MPILATVAEGRLHRQNNDFVPQLVGPGPATTDDQLDNAFQAYARKYLLLDDTELAEFRRDGLTESFADHIARRSTEASILADDTLAHLQNWRTYQLQRVDEVTPDATYLVMVYDGQDLHMPWHLVDIVTGQAGETPQDLRERTGATGSYHEEVALEVVDEQPISAPISEDALEEVQG